MRAGGVFGVLVTGIAIGLVAGMVGHAYLTGDLNFNGSITSAADQGITVTDEVDQGPEFPRTYKAKLDDTANIKIEAKTFEFDRFNHRFYSAELREPTGEWVIYDVDAIAKKILHPNLVPLVEQYTRQIIALDKDYMKTMPTSFTDRRGTIWRRDCSAQ